MDLPKIPAKLDYGPRTGETVEIHPGPDGAPPDQIVVADPLGEDTQPGRDSRTTHEMRSATTYHLHEPDSPDGVPVYRTGRPE